MTQNYALKNKTTSHPILLKRKGLFDEVLDDKNPNLLYSQSKISHHIFVISL